MKRKRSLFFLQRKLETLFFNFHETYVVYFINPSAAGTQSPARCLDGVEGSKLNFAVKMCPTIYGNLSNLIISAIYWKWCLLELIGNALIGLDKERSISGLGAGMQQLALLFNPDWGISSGALPKWNSSVYVTTSGIIIYRTYDFLDRSGKALSYLQKDVCDNKISSSSVHDVSPVD